MVVTLIELENRLLEQGPHCHDKNTRIRDLIP